MDVCFQNSDRMGPTCKWEELEVMMNSRGFLGGIFFGDSVMCKIYFSDPWSFFRRFHGVWNVKTY